MKLNNKLRILNLEDNPRDTELIQARLDEEGLECEIVRAETKEQYVHALEEGGFELILADYSLPGFDGLTALELAAGKSPEIPFIFVSGVIGEDLAIETLKRGATDYVLKNRLQRLGPAVRRAVLEATEKVERRRAEEELLKAHAELERRVEERTAELSRLAGSLQTEIAERKLVEDQVKKSLKEKEILLKELYHRTKNNMYVISSLIDLQSFHFKGDASMSIFRDIKNRIEAMALVHEKLYKSKSLSSLKAREYIKELAAAVLKTYKGMAERVSFELNVEDLDLSIDTAIPVGLVLNELISNSLQHAFPGQRSGKITISLRESGVGFHLNYLDNGTGLPEDFDIAKTGSLGLKIVYNIICKQLRGAIKIKDGRGTEFAIAFHGK